jgi:hypothetical protein
MGERFAMPTYPAAMSALPQPIMVPTRWHPARVTAAVLCFVALVLVVASTFLPLYSGELSFGSSDGFGSSETLKVTFTPWGADYSQAEMNSSPDNVPRIGYPLVFGSVVIACAAAACWYAATPAAGRTAGRAAGVLTAVSGAFLIGTVWTTALLVSNGVDSFLLLGGLGNGLETDASYLAGYWLLLTATLLGFAAAVLALLPARQPAWLPPPPVNPFVATPPFGFAIPTGVRAAGPPAPFAPPIPAGHAAPQTAHPLAVDPLTGQLLAVDPLTGQPLAQGPASPPVGMPAAVGSPAGRPLAYPIPFTPEAVPPVNGTAPEPPVTPEPQAAAEPITIPDAPPLPETPPGPAIPASEDPLAEPPKA